MPRDPWSTATAAAFPVGGFLGYWQVETPEALVVAVAFTALGAATGWRHWAPSRRSSKWDQVTMHGAFASLLLAGFLPWYFVLGGAVIVGFVLEWLLDLPLRKTFAVYGVLVLTEAAFLGPLWMAGGAAALLLGAVFVRFRYAGDGAHGLWHLLALGGMFLVMLAVTP